MNLLVIDVESYYDQEYSLSKMTTTEYLRDKRFEVILCGFQVNDGERYWVRGPEVANELKKFDPKETCVLCHNGLFDISILCWHYDFNPAFYLDTVSMFRYCFPAERAKLANVGPVLGLGKKGKEIVNAKGKHLVDFTEEELEAFGSYCLTDVRIAYEAFNIMKDRVPFKELQLIDLILRMFTEPVLELDGEILQALYDDEREKTVTLFSKVYPDLEAIARQAIFSGDEAAWKTLKTPLSSNPQFAKLLMEYGVDPPKKLSPSGVKSGRIIPSEVEDKPYGLLPPKEKTWTYAFSKSDEEFKDLLEDDNELLRTLCELRVNAKSTIKTTRAKTLINIQKTGTIPVSLKPFAAHTGRLGGSEWNPQNLPKFCGYCGGDKCGKCLHTGKSQLRLALMAPKGYVIVVRDLNAIEARVLAWLAEQNDILEIFRSGESVYCKDAEEMFGRKVTKADKMEYQLGKVKRLGSGYGLWTRTFQERVRMGILGMPGMILGDDIAASLGVSGENFLLTNAKMVRETKPKKIDELVHATHVACCDRIIKSFRDGNKQIVNYWQICQDALETMLAGGYDRIGRNGIIEVIPEGFRLPNGFVIQYTELKANREGKRTEYTILKDRQKGERGKVYGGLITENCLSAETKVLTFSGWKRIVDLKLTDTLWDGIEWVHHKGVVAQGKRPVINLRGLWITPEHKVLTNEGWKTAAEIKEQQTSSQSSGYYRAKMGAFNRDTICWLGRRKIAMGSSMRLRDYFYVRSERVTQRQAKNVRQRLSVLHSGSEGQESNSRYESSSGIRSLEKHDRSVRPAFAPSIQKLWWQRYNSLPGMDRFVPSILGRHEGDVFTRIDFRPNRQQQRILQSKLSVGNLQNPSTKQERKPHYKISVGGSYSKRSCGIGWYQQNYAFIPHRNGLAGRALVRSCKRKVYSPVVKQVYDILDSGPRQRFTVMGREGIPFIVHNCVQALSRVIMTDAMLEMRKEGLKVVHTIHDEILTVCRESEADDVLEEMGRIMETPPDWAEDLPLASEGGFDRRYVK